MQILTSIWNVIMMFVNSQAPDQILNYINKVGNLTVELVRNIIQNFVN